MILLGTMAALSEGGSRGFSVVLGQETLEGFMVRSGDGVYAYRNSCPHTGAPLDWTPDSFLNIDGTLIQCALHGALFQNETGLCVHGPCVNQHALFHQLRHVLGPCAASGEAEWTLSAQSASTTPRYEFRSHT